MGWGQLGALGPSGAPAILLSLRAQGMAPSAANIAVCPPVLSRFAIDTPHLQSYKPQRPKPALLTFNQTLDAALNPSTAQQCCSAPALSPRSCSPSIPF